MKVNDIDFSKIFEKIVKSRTMIPSESLISILAGVVNTSGKDNDDIKAFAEAVKDLPLNDAVSKTVLFTCNSIVMNLWNIFGDQFEEAYKKAVEAEKSESEEAHVDA